MSKALDRRRNVSADVARRFPEKRQDVSGSYVIATFAHEVRNVLAPLASSCELLHLSEVDEATERHAKDTIRRQVRHLTRLVNDLLDVHRLEHWQISAELRSTNVAEVIENVCSDYRYLFDTHAIELRVELPLHPVYSNVDAGRLGQVLSNLLSNCLKFTDRGGLVCVGLSSGPGENELTISVRDTGIGIASKDIERIFVSNTHQTSQRNREGLGLGLPLVRRIVGLFGGRVSAHSDGPGAGTLFSVVLPASSLKDVG